MFRVQPTKRRYFGPINLGNQPIKWMREHRSFADRNWLEGQVRYGKWVRERGRQNNFIIYATVTEGRKEITVLIKIEHCGTHVYVHHAHVLRKKK